LGFDLQDSASWRGQCWALPTSSHHGHRGILALRSDVSADKRHNDETERTMKNCGQSRVPGWVPYIWLAYLIFFLWQPVMNGASRAQWLATGIGLIVFLFFYFNFFRTRRPWPMVCVVAIGVIGILFAPFNGGAANFFIYAASMVPFALETEWAAGLAIAAVVLVAGLETWLLHINNGFVFPATFLSTFIGAANIYFAQRHRHLEQLRVAHAEIEQLAKVAERERIARDLHDVLGHTLSLITLKSELAGKLIERDPTQARNEIRDVEQTARQALADVRMAIGGYRCKGLAAEIQQAQATLETAGVKTEFHSSPVKLPAMQESVLAMVLREAVTNVVRHAQARNCRVQVDRMDGHCRLEIRDDGRGGLAMEGNGLRGMRERVEALGGSLERDTTHGTRLMIELPIDPAQELSPS
jgi:two-component system sensor histidine kinase DesK